MLSLLVALAISINVAYRPVVRHVGLLELNHFGTGTTQLIAWEDRQPVSWPIDWTTSPDGTFDGECWRDRNGCILVVDEFRESWTHFDPERKAYMFWRDKGESIQQGGIWKNLDP